MTMWTKDLWLCGKQTKMNHTLQVYSKDSDSQVCLSWESLMTRYRLPVNILVQFSSFWLPFSTLLSWWTYSLLFSVRSMTLSKSRDISRESSSSLFSCKIFEKSYSASRKASMRNRQQTKTSKCSSSLVQIQVPSRKLTRFLQIKRCSKMSPKRTTTKLRPSSSRIRFKKCSLKSKNTKKNRGKQPTS